MISKRKYVPLMACFQETPLARQRVQIQGHMTWLHLTNACSSGRFFTNHSSVFSMTALSTSFKRQQFQNIYGFLSSSICTKIHTSIDASTLWDSIVVTIIGECVQPCCGFCEHGAAPLKIVCSSENVFVPSNCNAIASFCERVFFIYSSLLSFQKTGGS